MVEGNDDVMMDHRAFREGTPYTKLNSIELDDISLLIGMRQSHTRVV